MSQEVSPGQLSVKTSTFALRPVGQNSLGVVLGAIDTDGVLDGAEDKVGAGDTVGTALDSTASAAASERHTVADRHTVSSDNTDL